MCYLYERVHVHDVGGCVGDPGGEAGRVRDVLYGLEVLRGQNAVPQGWLRGVQVLVVLHTV